MPHNKKIYIIGFMGSGKTTAGRKVADTLGWSFIDLDSEIEKKESRSVNEIFAIHGEKYFRQLESVVLRNPAIKSETVISTGGGAPCHSENLDFMKQTGIVIYLRLTPGQLVSRLADDSAERPLLKGLGSAGLRGFVEEKLKERDIYYKQATITVDGIDLNMNALIKKINSILQ